METHKVSRREREKRQQRQEVLDVALRLFSEKGYHNVSMHAIAKEAEFAIGTLYKFFRNKEDLYKALILQLSDRFYAAITAVIEADAPDLERLRAYVRVKGELFRDNVTAIRDDGDSLHILWVAPVSGEGEFFSPFSHFASV